MTSEQYLQTEPAVESGILTNLLSDAVERSVSFAPAEPWVKQNEVDESYTAKLAGGYSLLLSDQQCHAERHEFFFRTVYRIESVRGVHHKPQWRCSFIPASQQVIIHSLVKRSASQIVDFADAARVRVLHRDDLPQSSELTEPITLVVSLENMQVGDIVDVSYTVRENPPLLHNRFWTRFNLPQFTPMRAFHASVRFSASRALQWKSNVPESAQPQISQSHAEMEWQWNLENIPASEPEPNAPSWYAAEPSVQISDCTSWSEVASAFASSWPEHFDDPALNETALELAARSEPLSRQIQRAIMLVQDEIRNIASDERLADRLPATPTTVLNRKAGDSKDKASLLLHLLRKLGVSGRIVLVHSQWRQTIAEFLPSPDVFDRALVEHELEGRRFWADPTAAMQGGSSASKPLLNFGLGLPVSHDADGLEPIPFQAAPDDRYELREVFSIDTLNAQSMLTVIVTATGREADQLRRTIAQRGCDSFGEKQEQLYGRLDDRLTRTEDQQCHDDRSANKMVITGSYRLPGFDQRYALNLAATELRALLPLPENKKRTAPLALPYPCHFTQIVEVESAAIFAKHIKPFSMRNAAFRFSCEPIQRAEGIVLRCTLQTFTESITPENLDQYIANVREVMQNTSWQIRLPQGFSAPKRASTATMAGVRKPAAPMPTLSPASNEPAATTAAELPTAPAPLLSSRAVESLSTPAVSTKSASQEQKPGEIRARPAAAAAEAAVDAEAKPIQQPVPWRRGRLWIVLMFLTLLATNILLCLTKLPTEQGSVFILAAIEAVWGATLFTALWFRQSWARYVLFGYLLVSAFLILLPFRNELQRENGWPFIAELAVAFIVRVTFAIVLISSSVFRRMTNWLIE